MQSTSQDSSERFHAFVEQASKGRNSLPRILIGLCIILAVWFAGTFALMAGGAYALHFGWLPAQWAPRSSGNAFFAFAESRAGLVAAILTVGCIWPGVWLAVRLVHRRRLATLFGAESRIAGGDFWRALLATLIVAVLISLVTLLTEPKLTATGISPVTWLIALPIALVVLLIQTSAEEVLFRGYLMQTLAQRFRSPWVWAVAPALLFALAHWFPDAQPWMNAAVIFSIFLFAMGAVLLVKATGNLGAAMGMHFANNLVAFLFVTAGPPGQALAFFATPSVDDPSWTISDAAIGGLLQIVMMAAILALLLLKGSPLRLKSPQPAEYRTGVAAETPAR
ncbi:type II CAAX endopeptidase family protein [Mesorhizobium sp. LHD-90]|uniref:CPBP family intramembrane glutamic endopeptidase n=1 Tax=Mesorhizobium sp. LHD-90 TaxID=3071414 RepID=UPI0027E18815|nr:type II CAAX endopeptidase family protein [Mesorhizobium sp. LHD-90]MDQ6432864.1 type II CAAX endopeptidase family protein [Mesorhizobium sp. LHD-90]